VSVDASAAGTSAAQQYAGGAAPSAIIDGDSKHRRRKVVLRRHAEHGLAADEATALTRKVRHKDGTSRGVRMVAFGRGNAYSRASRQGARPVRGKGIAHP
jgi:hypothetical protein